MRLRKPIKNTTWRNSHISHAIKPVKCHPCTSAIARLRPIVAIVPLSTYWKFLRGSSRRSRRIFFAVAPPICIAAGLTPGTGSPFSIFRDAISPITKIFLKPGTVRSGSTKTRPALSVSTPRALPNGDAATPVAQTTTSHSIQSSPTFTRPESMSVTKLFRCTSTPVDSSCVLALAERSLANVPSTRSDPSKSITLALRVSMAMKSFARA